LLSEAYEDVIMDCVKRHKIKLALLAGIAIIVGYNFLKPERLFIVSQDRSFKIEIPRDIVKAHDCKAYKEWLHKHATPMLISSDRCPWSKPPKGPIGEFEINGVKLYVPRNYLLFDKRIPDGDTDNLTLLMKYPEMTAAGDASGRNDYHVMVSIDSPKMWGCCKDFNECQDLDKRRYRNFTNINSNNEKDVPNIVKKLYELPEERLSAYNINTNGYEYLLRGDPLKPDYWLQCAPEEASKNCSTCCGTTFNYNNELYVKYSFSRERILKTHDDLRNKIVSKINSFQQMPKEN
jgi:hypothetical protein